MGGHSLRQTAQRAAPDAQAGHRRERQERVHRIDALTVEVLGRVDEPAAAAERRVGQPVAHHMTDREQLSLRQAVAWLGDTTTIWSASRLLQPAAPDKKELARVTGRRLIAPVQDHQRARQ